MPFPNIDTIKIAEDLRRNYIADPWSAENIYRRQYPGAFSAADIYALMRFPGNITRPIGHLISVSVSTHRDTFPVVSMPYTTPRGFTQGCRTTAGTLIFHTIDKYGMLFRGVPNYTHADELPLFDIIITFVNEEGMASAEMIVGARILDFGKNMSLESLHPMESYSYMALDYVPMRPIFSPSPRRDSALRRTTDNREKKELTIFGGATEKFDTYDPLLQDYMEQETNRLPTV